MMTARKDIIIRMIFAALGLALFAFGAYLIIQCNLGASPWDVLTLGIAGKVGTIYGPVSITISAVLILVDLLVLKEKIGLGTILDAVVVGKSVDLYTALNILPLMEGSYLLRIAVLLAGFLAMGFGQYIYMKVGLSYGPRDTLQIGLGKIFHKIPIGLVNTGILAVVLTAGWFLGGPAGIGSFIAPLGVGLAQQFAFNVMGFDPKTVVNQDLFESIRIFAKGR